MSSYVVSERVNAQVILWELFKAPSTLVRLVRSIRLGWLWAALVAVAADAVALFGGLATVGVWCAGIATVVGAIASVLAVPQLVAGLAIVAVFGFVTKPR